MQRRVAGEIQERYRVSERRISMTLRFNRSSLQYTARRTTQRGVACEDQRARGDASAVRLQTPRVLLRREGWKVNESACTGSIAKKA